MYKNGYFIATENEITEYATSKQALPTAKPIEEADLQKSFKLLNQTNASSMSRRVLRDNPTLKHPITQALHSLSD